MEKMKRADDVRLVTERNCRYRSGNVVDPHVEAQHKKKHKKVGEEHLQLPNFFYGVSSTGGPVLRLGIFGKLSND